MTRSRIALLVSVLMLAALGGGAVRAAASPLPPIKHVFVIMLENKGYGETFGAQSPAPYLARTLTSEGAFVPNYYGVTHASLGNYIALVSGQGSNTATQLDCTATYSDFLPGGMGANGQALGTGCVYPKSVSTVANQLSARGLTWKGYMEDMATPCHHPALGTHDDSISAKVGDQYATRHNPFVYFHSIIDTPACAADDVPLTQLSSDLTAASRAPNLAFITPNLCHDGHDTPCVDMQPGGLVSADGFLSTWVPRILASPAYRSGGALAILFDEADAGDATACCNEPAFPNAPSNGGPLTPGPGGGHVGAVVLSPYIDPGTVDRVAFNHFSFLRTVEDLFRLSHLGYAAMSGLRSAGADLFTCYRAAPRARRGALPARSEIKAVQVMSGQAGAPALRITLWHPGRVTVSVRHVGRHRRAVGTARTLRVASIGQCSPLTTALPYRHGVLTVAARAYGGVERRTITY